MKNLLKFSFTNWLAGQQAVSFCLFVGVFFLISNYQTILHLTNPDNLGEGFKYPLALRIILSHLDSLFFGLATAIIMFQSENPKHKILYCVFEAIMIFLNLNRNFISDWLGFNAQIALGTYIAIFSGFTLYYLGNLAKQNRQSQEPETLSQNQPAPTTKKPKLNGFDLQNQPLNESQTIGFQGSWNADTPRKPRGNSVNYQKIYNCLDKGFSIRQTATFCKCSENTVVKAKRDRKTQTSEV
jgi:hypothetical protein